MNTKIVSFIERNKPIFMIGILLTAVFSILVIAYRLRPGRETELRKLNESEALRYKIQEDSDQKDGEDEEQHKSAEEEQHIDIDKTFGIVKVSYTKERGFSPMITRVYQGQKVTWTNNAEETIYLRQRKPTYSDLANDVEIHPGASFEFQMTELGIWTYKERDSKHEGSIDVKKLPDTLPEPKQEEPEVEVEAEPDLELETELEIEPEQELPNKATEDTTDTTSPVE
jgi:plastocyanin